VSIALNGDDTMTFTHDYSGKAFNGTDGKALIRQVEDHIKSLVNGEEKVVHGTVTGRLPGTNKRNPVTKAKAKKAAPAKDGDPLATKKTLKTGRSGVMVLKYHTQYMNNGGGSGDDLDVALREAVMVPVAKGSKKTALNWDALEDIADRHGVWDAKYRNFNPGMARMNVSNRLRAMLRRGEKVVIRGKTIPPIEAD